MFIYLHDIINYRKMGKIIRTDLIFREPASRLLLDQGNIFNGREERPSLFLWYGPFAFHVYCFAGNKRSHRVAKVKRAWRGWNSKYALASGWNRSRDCSMGSLPLGVVAWEARKSRLLGSGCFPSSQRWEICNELGNVVGRASRSFRLFARGRRCCGSQGLEDYRLLIFWFIQGWVSISRYVFEKIKLSIIR